MSTNICWVFQAKKNDGWIDIPSEYHGGRDQYLYSWLSLGGQPKVNSRGFPSDFVLSADGVNHPLASIDLITPHRRKFGESKEELKQFMGEWGHSWLSGTEILNSPIPSELLKIWVPIDAYNEWDKCSNPKIWYELHKNWQKQEHSEHYATPDSITEETWWVIIDFEYNFREHFEYFLHEVRRLIAIHGSIRFVFGFC